MSKSIKIRNMELGVGLPKICVPIIGEDETAVLREVEAAIKAGADLIEWRADRYQSVFEEEKTQALGAKIRERLGDTPMLFTFRTEDTEKVTALTDYIEINKWAMDSIKMDLIDFESAKGDKLCTDLCQYAHRKGIVSVLSNHDFKETPDKDVIVERLCKMHELGADVPKIAVVPNSARDVLTLLLATERYAREYAEGPFITMSMKGMGSVSRISGELFGSALTFGATKKGSAPGQLNIADLKEMLRIMHKQILG